MVTQQNQKSASHATTNHDGIHYKMTVKWHPNPLISWWKWSVWFCGYFHYVVHNQRERYTAVTSESDRHSKDADRNELSDKVALAVGMSLLVTLNVDMDLDVANGLWGTIDGIILDPNEPPFEPGSSRVNLQYLLLYCGVHSSRPLWSVIVNRITSGIPGMFDGRMQLTCTSPEPYY
jgi:hypothetical protein